eukprot:TRINITY_DN66640_c5_g3_i7.p3 TRINITY_DN66640_c5_g3~~TRINITY_DN66640_c5_g3_i7.p3  ORF type:complete len:106 (-),score=13.44 TRINITY_DN66640_c5_g3_i7:195-512(-)
MEPTSPPPTKRKRASCTSKSSNKKRPRQKLGELPIFAEQRGQLQQWKDWVEANKKALGEHKLAAIQRKLDRIHEMEGSRGTAHQALRDLYDSLFDYCAMVEEAIG